MPSTFPTPSTRTFSTEAREQAQLFDETVIGSREDLRSLTNSNNRPGNARDFDDAISLSRDEKGHWSLSVHIADVPTLFARQQHSTAPRGTGERVFTCRTG